MKKATFTTFLLAGVSALSLATSVSAQTADTKASDKSKDDSTVIVVTGSRVIKSIANSPTPITSVATEQLLTVHPGTIADGLNDLPVFSGSRNQFSNAGSNATGVQGGNGAANVLNLRNLGAYRTLVLYDGHRIPPTLFNSTVDVDLIPQELLQSVDVVTGGVSAVYGSDAVSGVVNFVPNRKFNGFSGHASYGISQRGDNVTTDIGAAAGTKLFGDKGHIEGSVEFRKDDGILSRSERSWDNLVAVTGAGTTAAPYTLNSNVHLAAFTFGGLITSGALSGQQFASNGVLSTFNKGTATGSSCCQIGGDGAYQNASMVSPSQGLQLYMRFDYDFSDTLHGFFVAADNAKTNTSYSGWNQLTNVTLSATNAFLPTVYQTALATATQTSFKLSEILSDAPRIENKSTTNQQYFTGGLEGHLGDYSWDATYSHGRSKLETQAYNTINYQNLAAALDAVKDGNGNIVCRASITNPSVYAGCKPLNLFGPTAADPAALAYVTGTVGFNNYTTMDAVDASFRGSPFSTWAGPVSMALSGEWRKLSYNATAWGQPTDMANCTSLGYTSANCTQGTTTLWANSFPSSKTISQTVSEEALEFDAPLLKDLPFAQSLDLNGAARYTHYSTSGNYTTWKIGIDWHLNDQWKVRATESADIRAPTLYDLYQPVAVVTSNYTDTLTGHTLFVPSINQGNPNLTAELGKTTTAGVVWKPSFLPGASLSLDAYHITIKNAISTIQGFNASIQAICYSSNGTSPYCSLIARSGGAMNSAADATAFYIEPFNIAQVETYGLDLEADYAHTVFGRRFNMRLLTNWQPHIVYSQLGTHYDQGGVAWGQNGLIASPSVQLSGFITYQLTDALRLDLLERYRNQMENSGVSTQVWANPDVKAYATTNVTFTYDLGNRFGVRTSSAFFTVENLFDKHPPATGYYSGNTTAGASYEYSDNPIGRMFTVGIRVRN